MLNSSRVDPRVRPAEFGFSKVLTMILYALVSGLIAGLLTLFDLDRTFYIPQAADKKRRLLLWWWGFIAANAFLASMAYYLVIELGLIEDVPALARAFVVGVAYLAIVRVKFATVDIKGEEVPVGIEIFYSAARRFFYRRIHRIAKEARYEETYELASRSDLEELATRVTLAISQDPLLDLPDKQLVKGWVKRVVAEVGADDLSARLVLADYYLSEQLPDDLRMPARGTSK